MAEVSVLLNNDLLALIARCRRETGYHPQQLAGMLEQHGAVETVHEVLLSPASEDFEHLCELRRPDLTVESFILGFNQGVGLFSPEELAIARERLAIGDKLVRDRRIAER